MTPVRRWLPLFAACGLMMLCVGPAAAAATTVASTPVPTWQTNGRVSAMVTVSGVTYLGGTFTSLTDHSGHTMTVSNMAAINAAGDAITTFHPTVDGEVKALVATHSRIYAGGDFLNVNGNSRQRLAVFARNGTLLSYPARTNGEVSALALMGGRLYVGGTFTQASGVTVSNVAAFNATTGAVTRWKPQADGRVVALLAQRNRILIGGYFRTVNGNPARRLASTGPVYGSSLPWAGHPSGEVLALTSNGRDVFAAVAGLGGAVNDYTSTGGRRWVRQVNGNAKTLIVVGGVVYVGGHFSAACSVTGGTCPALIPRPHLLALNAADGSLTPWNPGANSALGVYSFARAAGWLSVGGDFTVIGRASQAHYARLPITTG